jgi:hypothetical protein
MSSRGEVKHEDGNEGGMNANGVEGEIKTCSLYSYSTTAGQLHRESCIGPWLKPRTIKKMNKAASTNGRIAEYMIPRITLGLSNSIFLVLSTNLTIPKETKQYNTRKVTTAISGMVNGYVSKEYDN